MVRLPSNPTSDLQESSSADRRKRTVLVVDDDPQVRAVVVRILEAHGFDVLAARNGRAADRLLHDHEGLLDAAVVDAVLPGMNGLEVAGLIRQCHPETRILFISGHPSDPMVVRALDPYLAKPFSADALVTRVHELIENLRPDAHQGFAS
jgi:DNA-binding response OmpR family regulator